MDIKLEDYNFVYKKNKLLSDINYQFEKGNIYLLRGSNGSGKTMLLRAILGLINPSSGKRFVNEDESYDFLPSVGVAFNGTILLKDYSGRKNIEMLNNISNKASNQTIDELFEYFELKEVMEKKVKEYSLGMNQKLNLIQALMDNPDVICLDEPTNGLDKLAVHKLITYLEQNKTSKIIIIATHNLNEFEKCKHIELEIDGGKLI